MWITDRDLYGVIGALRFVGLAIGVAVFEGGPWLWAFVKPWLHSVTT